MHHSSHNSPNQQEKTSKHCSSYRFIVDPTVENVPEKLTPKTDIINFDVYYHNDCHKVHRNKNSERIESQPLQRSCDDLNRFFTDRKH